MTNECAGVFGYVFGHKLEPRYSTIEKPSSKIYSKGTIPHWEISDIIKETRSKTVSYHCDVCSRCGLTVNKKEVED